MLQLPIEKSWKFLFAYYFVRNGAMVIGLGSLILGLFRLVELAVVVWCLLSWFPSIRWYDQPFRTLDQFVQMIVGPFRRIIPPIGNIDISPMIALFILEGAMRLIATFLPY